MASERIAITGLGVVSPIGVGTKLFSRALREGRSGVRRITLFDPDGLDSQIAAEIDDAALDPIPLVRPPRLLKLMSRAATLAVVAAAMARDSSGLDSDIDPYRLGISLGAGGMGPVDMDLLEGQALAVLRAARVTGSWEFEVPAFAQAYRAMTNPIDMLRGLPNLAAAHVAIQQDARGPCNTVATACTSGTQAIGEGMRMIQRGEADVVFAGGADAMINPVGVLGFSMLGTLSRRNEEPERASRPFDSDRDGFVIGEGAAIVVLEKESTARARKAEVIAEAAGYAATCDAYRITDERPDAGSAAEAIRRCLADAAAVPEDVGYVNAHGTGTQMNDLTETRAIKEALGTRAASVPVSSTKSMIGHTLAAAGALELVAATLALEDEFLPPTINYETPDPECDLDYVPNESRSRRIDAALSNSFGFGGQNACLMIRRW